MKSKKEEQLSTKGKPTAHRTETMDVIELTSEYRAPNVDRKHAMIQVAEFADCFSVTYRKITLFFDISRIDDPLALAKILKDSFDYAIEERTLRTG